MFPLLPLLPSSCHLTSLVSLYPKESQQLTFNRLSSLQIVPKSEGKLKKVLLIIQSNYRAFDRPRLLSQTGLFPLFIPKLFLFLFFKSSPDFVMWISLPKTLVQNLDGRQRRQ